MANEIIEVATPCGNIEVVQPESVQVIEVDGGSRAGPRGPQGIGVAAIGESQSGSTVTLSFTLTNGATDTITFETGEVSPDAIRTAVENFLSNNRVDFAGAAYVSTQSYSIGDSVTSGSSLYISLTDNNSGNVVTDTAHWMEFSSGIQIVAGDPLNPTAGTVWYNSVTNQLRYFNGGLTAILIDEFELDIQIARALTTQNLEDHANTDTGFVGIDDGATIPVAQTNLLTTNAWIAQRTELDATTANTFTSLQYHIALGAFGVIRMFFAVDSGDTNNAQRREFLASWVNAMENGTNIVHRNLATNTTDFISQVTAVGDTTGGVPYTIADGEAFVELTITQIRPNFSVESLFSTARTQWIQSSEETVNGIDENPAQFFYWADAITAESAVAWVRNFTIGGDITVEHQNFSYVGNVDDNSGEVQFNPREVPVMWESNTTYFQGQRFFAIVENRLRLWEVTAVSYTSSNAFDPTSSDVMRDTNEITIASDNNNIEYLTASSIPTVPADLVAGQAYHIRVTNFTNNNLPTATRLTIDSNIIAAES